MEITRPDTPLDGLESEVTSVTSSVDKTSEEDTESFNGNLTASETRQNTQYNTIISLTEQLTLGETSATAGRFQEQEQEQEQEQVREPFDEYDIALFETIYPRPPSPFQPLPLYVPIVPMAQRIFKPEDFHGKADEDASTWLLHFEKVAAANEWTNNNKLRIVPVFLKDAAERWFVRHEFTHWRLPENPGEDDIGFTEAFLAQFNTELKKSRWNDQFDNLC